MKTLLRFAAGPLLAGLFLSVIVPGASAAPKRVLVVTVTTGFRHSSIPTAEEILNRLARESGAFTVDYARVTPPDVMAQPRAPKPSGNAQRDEAAQKRYEEQMAKYRADEPRIKAELQKYADEQKQVLAEKMSLAALKKYDAVIFANTTGDLPLPDKQGFIDWVKAGHGFAGMHSASDTFHPFRPYLEMLGGEFQTHGAQVSVDCSNQDAEHPACRHLPASWTVFDEIYLMKSFDRNLVHGLLGLDKHPNDKTPGYYPVSWCKEFGKGRVFYTSLGHREDIWDDQTPPSFQRKNPPEVSKAYQQHILNGIKWTLGLLPGDAKPQTQ